MTHRVVLPAMGQLDYHVARFRTAWQEAALVSPAAGEDREGWLRLEILDFTLSAVGESDHLSLREQLAVAASLEDRLVEGGSEWTVAAGEGELRWALEQRVSPELRELAQRAAEAAPTEADELLAQAWRHCYGRGPDPEKAVQCAVRAMEAVVVPATTPRDSAGTFGKSIAHLRRTAAEWTVGGLSGGDPAPGLTVAGMLDLVWANQDRHASGARKPPATQESAELAVHIAALVVHWFSRGPVVRGDK